MEQTVCKICVMKRGLSGADLHAGKCDYAFKTEEEFHKHLKEVHNMRVMSIEEQARKLAEEMYAQKGKKGTPDFWICGYNPISTSKEAECAFCKQKIYYDNKMAVHYPKKHKKLCVKCGLTKFQNELTLAEMAVLKKSLRAHFDKDG